MKNVHFTFHRFFSDKEEKLVVAGSAITIRHHDEKFLQLGYHCRPEDIELPGIFTAQIAHMKQTDIGWVIGTIQNDVFKSSTLPTVVEEQLKQEVGNRYKAEPDNKNLNP